MSPRPSAPPLWALGLYNTLGAAAAPFLLPLLALHPRLSGGLSQRFGLWRLTARERTPVWLHGASAGDVAALVPLGRELAAAGHPLVASAWTRSGHQMASRLWRGEAPVFRAPLDLVGPVRRVLAQVRPALVVLECLELWPNLLTACLRRGIPVAVVNGRLSRRSARGYRRARWLFGPCLESLSLVSALTSDDARRFVELGVPSERVMVETSSKHGVVVPEPVAPDRPKLVLGSIHRGEEAALLPWVSRLARAVPRLRVVIAPRYPHRAPAILRRLNRDGIESALLSGGESQAAPVVIHDGVGALASAYHGASVAFVGGSLTRRGGHNVMEPAARGVPVLTGPHVEHCRREVELLTSAGGGLQVGGGDQFGQATLALLRDPRESKRRGQRALEVARHLAAAPGRIAERLLPLIGRRESR